MLFKIWKIKRTEFETKKEHPVNKFNKLTKLLKSKKIMLKNQMASNLTNEEIPELNLTNEEIPDS